MISTRKALYHNGTVSEWWKVGGIDPATCVAAYQPKGAISYEDSKINLANPGTYNAYGGVNFGWNDHDGWIGNKTTTHLLTGIQPPTGAELEWSIIARFTGMSPIPYDFGYEVIIGGSSGYNTDFSLMRRNDFQFRNGVSAAWNGDPASGIAAISAKKGYFNGVPIVTIGAGSYDGTPIIIGARYTTNTYVFGGQIQAAAIYNTALTDPQIAALTAAMNAL